MARFSLIFLRRTLGIGLILFLSLKVYSTIKYTISWEKYAVQLETQDENDASKKLTDEDSSDCKVNNELLPSWFCENHTSPIITTHIIIRDVVLCKYLHANISEPLLSVITPPPDFTV